MNLITIAGKVSHVNRIASTLDDGGRIVTNYVTALRIDGRHVEISDDVSWAAEGDHVAIVAEQGVDGLVPLAIRNDTTGYEDVSEVSSSYGFAVLMIVLGVVLVALIIGIFMIAWGLWTIYKVNTDKKVIAEAKRRLDSIPRARATAAA